MILAADVDYREHFAVAAGVLFEHWQDDKPVQEVTSRIESVADYEPGSFYKRELPCILQLLDEYALSPEIIVVDGFVYLDGISIPGLGKHLYDALDTQISVIGVAKKPFKGIGETFAVYRGKSTVPLYVTSVGIETEAAKNHVKQMHGPYRIPTMLKRVDQLSRDKY